VHLHAGTIIVNHLLVHGYKHLPNNFNQQHDVDVVLNQYNFDDGYYDFHVLQLHEYDLDDPHDHITLNVVHGDADEQ
jgi:hypothetical protein